MEFTGFDARGYRTVDARSGYAAWSATYEDTVCDPMDIGLLERLTRPAWREARCAADLGCGTGRTGAWLRAQGVRTVHGVDLTPQMLDLARQRGVHTRLVEADVTATGLPAGAYDLLVSSLVDEHLADVRPLYREAWRLAADDALFVLVGYHPHFIMHAGMPTHYRDGNGEDVAITTTVHLVSDHVTAAMDAGWELAEMREGVIDDGWLAVKPQWERHRGHPVSAAYVWRKGDPVSTGMS